MGFFQEKKWNRCMAVIWVVVEIREVDVIGIGAYVPNQSLKLLVQLITEEYKFTQMKVQKQSSEMDAQDIKMWVVDKNSRATPYKLKDYETSYVKKAFR